jgi:hypothetical protein
LKRPHKFAGYKMVATTKLDRTAVAEIARQAGDSAKGNAWSSPGRSRFEQATPDRLTFSVRDRLGREMMTYSLRLSETGGVSKINVSIDSYKQMQQKFLGLIPLGPAKLLGLAAYQDFIQLVESGLSAKDSSAACDVTVA